MANIPAKMTRVNKFIGLALQACKKYKGRGMVHYWSRQALHYLMLAKSALREGLASLYKFAMDMANTRVRWANHELMLSTSNF